MGLLVALPDTAAWFCSNPPQLLLHFQTIKVLQ
jgi:hypothetical protein